MKGKSSSGSFAKIAALVEDAASEIARENGLSIWDVEFKKEGPAYVLRVYIDAQRPIGTDDCERVSRALDAFLDREDPIEQSYCLEVSSPGVERVLRKDWHFQKYIGHEISVRGYRAEDGRKEHIGELIAYDGDKLSIRMPEGERHFALGDVASARLYVRF